jgi:hypothetical protein
LFSTNFSIASVTILVRPTIHPLTVDCNDGATALIFFSHIKPRVYVNHYGYTIQPNPFALQRSRNFAFSLLRRFAHSLHSSFSFFALQTLFRSLKLASDDSSDESSDSDFAVVSHRATGVHYFHG